MSEDHFDPVGCRMVPVVYEPLTLFLSRGEPLQWDDVLGLQKL